MTDGSLISVIVSSFNGADVLPRLLESLESQEDVELEIIVVDRHSTDETARVLAGHPGVAVLEEPAQSGLAAGYAVGAGAARGSLLFFCNEDMWFDGHCLSRLASHIDLGRRIGAADPWQWSYEGECWIHGGVRFLGARWEVNSPYPFRRCHFTVDLPAGTEIPMPCAGAFLIHRVAYDDIGGWDTTFFLDHEDTDLFIRAYQRDWRSVTVPDAKVYHKVGLSGRNVRVNARRYASSRSNMAVIGLKCFSWHVMPLVGLNWLLTFFNNLLKFRWGLAVADLASLRLTASRLPAALGHRAATRGLRARLPGEAFFRDERFQGGRDPAGHPAADDSR